MFIIFQMSLVTLNAAIAAINYTNGNFGVAMFNAGTVGFCLAMALAHAMPRRG